jgi:hypothetical protein
MPTINQTMTTKVSVPEGFNVPNTLASAKQTTAKENVVNEQSNYATDIISNNPNYLSALQEFSGYVPDTSSKLPSLDLSIASLQTKLANFDINEFISVDINPEKSLVDSSQVEASSIKSSYIRPRGFSSMMEVMLFLINLVLRQLDIVREQRKNLSDINAANLSVAITSALNMLESAKKERDAKLSAADLAQAGAITSAVFGLTGSVISLGSIMSGTGASRYKTRQSELEVSKNKIKNGQDTIKTIGLDSALKNKFSSITGGYIDKENRLKNLNSDADIINKNYDTLTKSYLEVVKGKDGAQAKFDAIDNDRKLKNLSAGSPVVRIFSNKKNEVTKNFVNQVDTFERAGVAGVKVSLFDNKKSQLNVHREFEVLNGKYKEATLDPIKDLNRSQPFSVASGEIGMDKLTPALTRLKDKDGNFDLYNTTGNTTTFVYKKDDKFFVGQIEKNVDGSYRNIEDLGEIKGLTADKYNKLTSSSLYMAKHADSVDAMLSSNLSSFTPANEVNRLKDNFAEGVYAVKSIDAESRKYNKIIELRDEYENDPKSHLGREIDVLEREIQFDKELAQALGGPNGILMHLSNLVNGTFQSEADKKKAIADFIARISQINGDIIQALLQSSNQLVSGIIEVINGMLNSIMSTIKTAGEVAAGLNRY